MGSVRARCTCSAGTHDVTIAEGSLSNFSDVDLPVTERATLTAGADTLLVVLTRRFGTPLTTLSGSPLVSSTPLTLELPDAQLTPIVELPEPLLGGSVSTNVILADRWFCGDRREIVTDPQRVHRRRAQHRPAGEPHLGHPRAGHVSAPDSQFRGRECAGCRIRVRPGGVPSLDTRARRCRPTPHRSSIGSTPLDRRPRDR